MTLQSSFGRRSAALLGIGIILLASIIPLLLSQTPASAASLTNRKITLGSSNISTSTTYDVSFDVGSTTNILGIVVDLCANSPLVGQSCSTVVSGSTVSGTVGVSVEGVLAETFNVDVDTVGSESLATGTLLLTHATGLTGLTIGDTVTFSFTATNPGTLTAFYGRIITMSTEAAVDAYVATAGPATTGYIDTGGVALMTARQLTVNARVQEQLEFCVSAIDGLLDTDAEVPANCAGMPSDTEVNLGVIDNGTPTPGTKGMTPVPSTNGGNDKNGGLMVRTNAANGAVISYRAEQETSSGALKVIGQTCLGTNTDQCFNNPATPLTDFTAAGEKFGMSISDTLKIVGSETDNLTADANYAGNGTAAGGFTWVSTGTPTVLANTSSTVSDYELAILRFAARAAATTPTGAYTVTSTYIATATY